MAVHVRARLMVLACGLMLKCSLDETGLSADGGLGDVVVDVSGDVVSDSEPVDGAPSDSQSDSQDVTPPFDAGFLPTALGGLVLWLRADLGTTVSGSNVTTWFDQSANGFNLDSQDGANSFSPVGGPNATAAISFSGGGLYRNAALIPNADAARTMCLVVQSSLLTGEMAVLQDGPVTANGIGYYLNATSPSTRDILITNVLFEIDTASPLSNAWEKVCIINTGASQQGLRVAGTDQALSTSMLKPSGATTTFSLGGAHPSPAYNFHGSIAEVVAYNRVLSTPEQLQLEGYLSARYGL